MAIHIRCLGRQKLLRSKKKPKALSLLGSWEEERISYCLGKGPAALQKCLSFFDVFSFFCHVCNVNFFFSSFVFFFPFFPPLCSWNLSFCSLTFCQVVSAVILVFCFQALTSDFFELFYSVFKNPQNKAQNPPKTPTPPNPQDLCPDS